MEKHPKIIKTYAKEIFTRSGIPGCGWVINHYVGCGHNCNYCYAHFMARWKNFGAWGTWIEAKINAPDLVKNRFAKGSVFMSSVSDAYQPIEQDLQLTRRVLENLDKNIELSILTKSNLVLRDIDILKQFKHVEVGFTINSFTGIEKKIFEPDSSTNEERIDALRTLKENGIKTYVFISPIIPKIVDVKSVIEKTRNYAEYYIFEMINMRGSGFGFLNTLKKHYPESYNISTNQELFANYIRETKTIIARQNVTTDVFVPHSNNNEPKKRVPNKPTERNLELF